VADRRYDTLWLFNDSFPSVQFIASRPRYGHGSGERIFVDEGASSYSSVLYPQPGLFERALRRLCIGPWWREAAKLGASGYVDRALLFFPEHAHPALRSVDRKALDPSAFRCQALRKLARDYLSAAGWRGSEAAPNVLVFCAHSDTIRPFLDDYVAAMHRVVSNATRRGRRVVVKLHPRERDRRYVEAVSRGSTGVVPQQVPGEFLVLAWSASLESVVGDFSTAMITARWLCPELDCVVLADLVERGDPRLAMVLDELGVRSVSAADGGQGVFGRHFPVNPGGE
jgi:hypothetical protein